MDQTRKTIAQMYEEDKDLLEAAKTKEEIIYASWNIKKHGFNKEKEIKKILEEKYNTIELVEGATIIVTTFLNSFDTCERDFFNRTNCSVEEFIYALNILRTSRNDLYQKYFKIRRQKEIEFGQDTSKEGIMIRKKIDNIDRIHQMSLEEKLSIFTQKGNQDSTTNIICFNNKSTNYLYSTYCSMYNLSPSIVNYYVKTVSKKELEAFILDSKEGKEGKINRFINESRTTITGIAREMQEILRFEKSIMVNNLTIKAPMFNLYDFEATNRCSFSTITSLAKQVDCPNSEKIILTYIRKHKSFFEKFTNKKAQMVVNSGIISCEGRSIKFQPLVGREVINDMEEKRIPTYRGALFQEIERKVCSSDESTKSVPVTYQKRI